MTVKLVIFLAKNQVKTTGWFLWVVLIINYLQNLTLCHVLEVFRNKAIFLAQYLPEKPGVLTAFF